MCRFLFRSSHLSACERHRSIPWQVRKKSLAPTVSEEITTPRFYFCSSLIITDNKILKSDWLSTVLILALIGRCNHGTVRAIAHACLNGLFDCQQKEKLSEFLVF